MGGAGFLLLLLLLLLVVVVVVVWCWCSVCSVFGQESATMFLCQASSGVFCCPGVDVGAAHVGERAVAGAAVRSKEGRRGKVCICTHSSPGFRLRPQSGERILFFFSPGSVSCSSSCIATAAAAAAGSAATFCEYGYWRD